MPNHCENDLELSGKQEDIDRFLSYACGDEDHPFIDFNKFIPYPEEFANADREYRKWEKEWEANGRPRESYSNHPADGYNNGGYNWCVDNWGTKWNAYDQSIDDSWGLILHFTTAWSPPIPVIYAMAKMFPEIDFTLTYFEGGMEFNGILQVKGEDILREEQGVYFGDRGG